MMLIAIFCLAYPDNSIALSGDILVVNESLVNVRSGPSNKAESVIKLKENRKVTEIQRQNNWVEVELHRDDINTGWIHSSLLSKASQTQNTSSPTRFDVFMQRFNDHNEVIKKQNGDIYFTKASHKGKGNIEVIATEVWLNKDMESRNNTLSEIFKMWSDVVPVGSSISVHVVDEHGERYTVMLR